MSIPSLFDFLDYTSADCIERLLRNYYEIEHLAHKGYPAVIDLHLELKTALSKLGAKESQVILNAVGLQDENSIKTGAMKLQEVLLG